MVAKDLRDHKDAKVLLVVPERKDVLDLKERRERKEIVDHKGHLVNVVILMMLPVDSLIKIPA
jgi:hypothetical protein